MGMEKRGFVFIIGLLLIVLISNSVVAEGMDQGVQGAMQAVQQIVQLVTQIFGNLKTNLESNVQSEHSRLAKVNAPRLPEDPSDGTPTVLGTNTSNNRLAMDFRGLEVTLEDRNTGNKLIVRNGGNTIGTFNTNKSLENTITANTTTIVNKQGQDLGVVQVGNQTTLIDSGAATVGQTTSSTAILKGFLPLVSAVEIGEQVIQFERQYVLFVEDDIFINGENILFLPLKNFDEIVVNGSGLILMEQDSDFIVNKEKSFYSRKIGKNDFFVNRIINPNNREISFRLLDGGSKGVYLTDNKNILSVGESVVENPLVGYENLSIPRSRFQMWKKASEII